MVRDRPGSKYLPRTFLSYPKYVYGAVLSVRATSVVGAVAEWCANPWSATPLSQGQWTSTSIVETAVKPAVNRTDSCESHFDSGLGGFLLNSLGSTTAFSLMTTTTTSTTTTALGGGAILRFSDTIKFKLSLTLFNIPVNRAEADCGAATMNRLTERAKSADCTIAPSGGPDPGVLSACLGPEKSICAVYWSLIVVSAANSIKNSGSYANLQVSPPSISNCLLNANPKANFWPSTFVEETRDPKYFVGIDDLQAQPNPWAQKGAKFLIGFELVGTEGAVDGTGISSSSSNTRYAPTPHLVAGVWGKSVQEIYRKIITDFEFLVSNATGYALTNNSAQAQTADPVGFQSWKDWLFQDNLMVKHWRSMMSSSGSSLSIAQECSDAFKNEPENANDQLYKTSQRDNVVSQWAVSAVTGDGNYDWGGLTQNTLCGTKTTYEITPNTGCGYPGKGQMGETCAKIPTHTHHGHTYGSAGHSH